MSKVGYGNSHEGYYKKREKRKEKKKRSLRAVSNSSKTITKKRKEVGTIENE